MFCSQNKIALSSIKRIGAIFSRIMVDISESELTLIENAFVKMRDALAEDESPEATDIKQSILEAEQIVSGLIDKEKSPDTLSGPTGGSNVLLGAQEASVEDVQAIAMHLEEALTIIQKIMPVEGTAPAEEATPFAG
jgi:hypothetical protein